MKILFINNVEYGQLSLPEGIAVLSAVLKEQGHEVELFDTALLKPNVKAGNDGEKDSAGISFHKRTPFGLNELLSADSPVDKAEELSSLIESYKPAVIGVSAMTTNVRDSLRLIGQVFPAIRKIGCKVVFGGVHPTLLPEEVIRRREVDYVCVGEGEHALVTLCEYLEKGKDVTKIKNLNVKTREQGHLRTFRNESTKFVCLDEIPPPDLSLFDQRHFFRPFDGKIYRGIFMSTSRGCPRGCAYCVNNRLKDMFRHCGRYLRFQPPRKVASNISYLKKNYGIEWFKFSDDTFLMRPLEELYELRDMLKPMGIMFGCSVDPATVTEEKVCVAREMGCVSMSIGVETGNENIRRKVLGRYISNEQIKRAIRLVREHGIKVSAFNMIGLPGETTDNVYETIQFNKELEIPDANVYILYPFPGTKIHVDHCVPIGPDDDYPPMSEAHQFNLSAMTSDELLGFLRTFNLYLVLPQSSWDQIEEAKAEPSKYEQLVKNAQDIVDRRLSVSALS